MTPTQIPQFIIRSEAGLRQLSLTGQTSWIIGRSKSCPVWIDDPWASRRHAQVDLIHSHYCLTDLDSRNGTLLNGLPISIPTRLKHGDRISIGNTELEFTHPTSVSNGSNRWEAQPQILMLQSSNAQNKIWQDLLQSQNAAVEWHVPTQDLQAKLLSCHAGERDFPHVLLLDVAIYPANPYALCRWCSETCPQIKIILLNSTQREVMPTERHWALKQGCVGLLPALPESSLLERLSEVKQHISVILEALNLPLDQGALTNVLAHLDAQLTLPKMGEDGEFTMVAKGSRLSSFPVGR